MDDVDQHKRKRPGVAFAGFLVPCVLLLTLMLGYRSGYFAAIGWRGGEYAYAFIGVAVGTLLVGSLLKLVRPPWNSFGTGMIVGGVLGVLSTIAIFVLVVISLSQWGRVH